MRESIMQLTLFPAMCIDNYFISHNLILIELTSMLAYLKYTFQDTYSCEVGCILLGQDLFSGEERVEALYLVLPL